MKVSWSDQRNLKKEKKKRESGLWSFGQVLGVGLAEKFPALFCIIFRVYRIWKAKTSTNVGLRVECM